MLHSNEKYCRLVTGSHVSNTSRGVQTVAYKRHELTEEGERYLRETFPTTISKILAREMGISLRSLLRLAYERGLKKNEGLLIGQSEALSKGVQNFYKSDKGKAHRQMLKDRGAKQIEKYRFGQELGEVARRNLLSNEEKMKIRNARLSKSWKKTYQTDKARCLFGLEQKTGFKYPWTDDKGKQRKVTCVRYNLRQSGCTVAKGSFAVYNHEKVGDRLRENAKKMGFIFKN